MRLHAIAVLIALPLSAATIKPETVGVSEERLHRIHETMQAHIDSHDITGGVTLVARKGRVIHLEAHGLMDREAKKPVSTDSIFRIYSMTKPVVGVAILLLMEEGKVRLNDPVSKFIPEYKGMKVAVAQQAQPGATPQYYPVPASREIIIQDLLTHVSGLGSGDASRPQLPKIEELGTQTLAAIIPRFAASQLDFQPGSKWGYSGLAAFDTLGRVVEVVSGQSFDQFLRKRLFEPLGMKETFFHPGEERWPRVVTSYTRKDGALIKTESPNSLVSKTYFSGGGGLLSTAEDYAQFALMLANGGQLNGKRLLSPKTVELMASAFVPDTTAGRSPGRAYGLSVQVVTDPVAAGYRMSAGSYGWDGAAGTHFWVDPKEQIVGIMMVQTMSPNRQLDRDFENAVMQAIVE
jgi:CubicO group peptidase (beta-lactamase class C family)